MKINFGTEPEQKPEVGDLVYFSQRFGKSDLVAMICYSPSLNNRYMLIEMKSGTVLTYFASFKDFLIGYPDAELIKSSRVSLNVDFKKNNL